jgi:putative tricarboxylic transport membrane protein
MKGFDRVTSLIQFLLAVFLIWQSSLMPIGRFGKPGPGFLPLGVGILMALLSGFLWIEAGLQKSPPGKVRFLTGEGRWPGVVWTVVSLLAYALLVESLGFLLTTLFLLLFLFRFIGKQIWWLAITETFSITLVAHLLFKVALKVQLPGGLFSF